MALNKFPTDSLSEGLKDINPSTLTDLPAAAQSDNILQTFNNAKPTIELKVKNGVSNFQKLETGSVPKVELPSLDTTSFTNNPINDQAEKALSSFSTLKKDLNAQNLKSKLTLVKQLTSVSADDISVNETVKIQGDMFSDIKGQIGNISNNQLRNFNLDTSFLDQTVSDITNKTIEAAKIKVQKGTTDASKFNNQVNVVDKLNNLV